MNLKYSADRPMEALLGSAEVVIFTGEDEANAAVMVVSGSRSSDTWGRPESGNTSKAMVPMRELALEYRLVATRSFSSFVMVSRTRPRTMTS